MTLFPRYRGPAMNTTVNNDGHRVHRLADDRPYYGREQTFVIRRDPMVAALFGAPAPARPRNKRAG